MIQKYSQVLMNVKNKNKNSFRKKRGKIIIPVPRIKMFIQMFMVKTIQ